MRAQGQAGGGEARLRQGGDGPKIEQYQADAGCPAGRGAQEAAVAAADIEHAFVPGDAVGVQHLVGDQGLRGGHQGGVRTRPRLGRRRLGAGIGPVGAERGFARLAAQQGDGVAQIGVEHGVMLDHRGDAGIADHRGTEIAQAEPPVAVPLGQPQRRRRLQQPQRVVGRQVEPGGEGRHGLRAGRQDREKIKPHTGKKHLRVDEAGDDIEQRAGAAARDRAGEREDHGKALEARAGQQPVPPRGP